MKQLKQLFANFRKDLDSLKLKVSTADDMEEMDGPEEEDEAEEMCSKETYEYGIRYVHERISYLEQYFYDYIYNHQKGHLPPITSVEQMKNALDVLGLSEEYEVAPKVIYSKEGKAESFLLEFKPKK